MRSVLSGVAVQLNFYTSLWSRLHVWCAFIIIHICNKLAISLSVEPMRCQSTSRATEITTTCPVYTFVQLIWFLFKSQPIRSSESRFFSSNSHNNCRECAHAFNQGCKRLEKSNNKVSMESMFKAVKWCVSVACAQDAPRTMFAIASWKQLAVAKQKTQTLLTILHMG